MIKLKKSYFVKTLGNRTQVRVLDFLIENRIFDYSKTDIAREVQISRATLDSFWDNLVSLNFVKKTRTIGRATLYTLNRECPSVKKMIEFDLELSTAYADKITEKRNN